jgi:hypothetical protein
VGLNLQGQKKEWIEQVQGGRGKTGENEGSHRYYALAWALYVKGVAITAIFCGGLRTPGKLAEVIVAVLAGRWIRCT